MSGALIMNKKPRVLVTRRWPSAIESKLSEEFDAVFNRSDTPLNATDFRQAFSDFDAILPTVTDKLGPEVLDMAQARTKILANYGVGYSHIDTNATQKLGITVTNTPDVLSDCTADLAMTLLLMVARRAGEGEREIRSGNWSGWRPTHMMGSKVTGKTLGIVGFGRIGQAMAQRAHHGFGMKIVVHNRSAVKQAILKRYNATQVATLDDLLPQSDFVSLHCPGGAENRHLMNNRRLELMKPDAFLINTARGEVIDEYALAQSLMFGCIGGAGLDVYQGEPKISSHLLQCDNLVVLPHLGSASIETRNEMGNRVVQNLIEFFNGREPLDKVA